MARNVTESEVERYLIAGVKARGGMALKMVMVGDRGSPDRWCMMPNGKIILAECKFGNKGVLSMKQISYIEKFKNLGFSVYVVSTKDEVDEMFKKEGL